MTDVTDVTHIGLDKHLIEQPSDGQLANSSILNDNNCKEIKEINNNNKEIITGKEEEDHPIPAHPSQASHPSPVEQLSPSSLYNGQKNHTSGTIDVSKTIYRLGHSDTWACRNCKQKGDIHYMKQHNCRGQSK